MKPHERGAARGDHLRCTPRRAARCATATRLAIALSFSTGCDAVSGGGEAPPETSASATPIVVPREVDETVVPPRRTPNPNPLDLPATGATYATGQVVYTVPERALAEAKVGSSFQLRAAKVESMDGLDVIVRMGTGPAYTVHSAYVVAPRSGRVERGALVLAPYRELLRHGVVQKRMKTQVALRYGDVALPIGEQVLDLEAVGLLEGGLEPGAYALERDPQSVRVVQLVSSGKHADGVTRWLTLGADGEARLVDEKSLGTMPDSRKLKADAPVLVAWRGEMVPGVVKSVETLGILTVKRPRVGPAMVVGYDLVMPAAKTGP